MVKETKKNVYDLVIKRKSIVKARCQWFMMFLSFVVLLKIYLNMMLYSKGVRILKFDEEKSLDIDNLHEYNLAKFFYSKKN